MSAPSDATSWDAGRYQNRHNYVWEFGRGVVELLAPQPAERILDVGCGNGELTASIAAAGARVTGLDRSPEMIAAAEAAGGTPLGLARRVRGAGEGGAVRRSHAEPLRPALAGYGTGTLAGVLAPPSPRAHGQAVPWL